MSLGVVVLGALLAAAAVVVAELAARAWIRGRRRYYVLPPGLRMRLEVDRPTFPQLEPVVRFEVNRDGERGGAVPRGPGLYRVLVGGGSQAEGFLLDQFTSWPGALQRLLEQPEHLDRLGARRVHVGSIARSGVGSEALDLIFDRALPHYPRLQLIVVLVGATDVLRWLEHDAPALPAPVRTADAFRCHPEGPFGWTPRSLAAVELLARARRRWLRPVQVHPRAGRWISRARTMRARARDIEQTMPDPAGMLAHFEFHFRRVLARAAAHADRVLVVRQPWFDRAFTPEEAAHMWHGGAGQVWREDVTTYYSFEVVSRLMALVDASAERVAADVGVEQVDLMPWLPCSLETYYDGFHHTPAGARAVATLVAAAVLRLPIPQPRVASRAS
jgi:lysophospholipase L1-like esterase